MNEIVSDACFLIWFFRSTDPWVWHAPFGMRSLSPCAPIGARQPQPNIHRPIIVLMNMTGRMPFGGCIAGGSVFGRGFGGGASAFYV